MRLRAPDLEIPPEERLRVRTELHWRSRTGRASSRAFKAALRDPAVRDIAPLVDLHFSGPHAAGVASRVWHQPLREPGPTAPRREIPEDWIADFKDRRQCDLRLWPDAWCLLGQLPDGPWQIAVVSGRAWVLAQEPGRPDTFREVEHRTAWAARWWADHPVIQQQWVTFHPTMDAKVLFEDLFRRSGWLFVQSWGGPRPRGALGVNRLEIVAPPAALATGPLTDLRTERGGPPREPLGLKTVAPMVRALSRRLWSERALSAGHGCAEVTPDGLGPPRLHLTPATHPEAAQDGGRALDAP